MEYKTNPIEYEKLRIRFASDGSKRKPPTNVTHQILSQKGHINTTMKLYVSFLLAVAAADAFAPTPMGVRNSVRLYSRPDTSEYVAAALEASKKYGATSKEAQIAWETVEEMDSADNSNAYTGGMPAEYKEKLAELSRMIETEAPKKLETIKNLASEITAIKLANPERIAGSDSPLLRQALDEAKKATEEFGVESSEAKLAWESVEEIASASNDNAMGVNLVDECLVEQIEACQGLEELSRVLNLESGGSRYSG
jgi:hypothetical protein